MGSWVTYGLGTENAESARLHHDLPDLWPRRRQQLELGVSAGRLPGHAARQREHPVGSSDPIRRTCRPSALATSSACSSNWTCSSDERATNHAAGPDSRARRPASSRSSWPSACRPSRPSCQDLSGESDATQQALRPRRTRRRPTSAGSACWPGGSSSRASASSRCTATVTSGTSTATSKADHAQERAAKSTSRSPACSTDLKSAGLARRHAGDLGRRVRPHAHRPGGQRRPRSQPARLHDVAGRRRRQGGHHATARPTTTATTPSRTRSTSTTCTRRSCTCWASITRS